MDIDIYQLLFILGTLITCFLMIEPIALSVLVLLFGGKLKESTRWALVILLGSMLISLLISASLSLCFWRAAPIMAPLAIFGAIFSWGSLLPAMLKDLYQQLRG